MKNSRETGRIGTEKLNRQMYWQNVCKINLICMEKWIILGRNLGWFSWMDEFRGDFERNRVDWNRKI